MRSVLPISAGLVVISGIVSATMWHELRKEREVTADLRSQLAMALIRPAAPAPQRNEVQPVGAAPPASVEAVAKSETAPARAAAPAGLPLSIQDSLNQQKELLKDPEYRKAQAMQTRMNIERNYPGLVEELGLTEKEADRLFDLLTENQLNRTSQGTSILTVDTRDAAAMNEMMQKQQALQRQEQEAVAALLGPGKFSQWQEYQQTRTPRMQATSFGTQLAQAGQPLNATQQKALTSALIAQQKREQQDMTSQAARFAASADPDARRELSLKMSEERNQRILEAATPHLSAQQVATLRQQFDSQAAMSRASMRLQRAREQAQGAAQPAQPPTQTQRLLIIDGQSVPVITQ